MWCVPVINIQGSEENTKTLTVITILPCSNVTTIKQNANFCSTLVPLYSKNMQSKMLLKS